MIHISVIPKMVGCPHKIGELSRIIDHTLILRNHITGECRFEPHSHLFKMPGEKGLEDGDTHTMNPLLLKSLLRNSTTSRPMSAWEIRMNDVITIVRTSKEKTFMSKTQEVTLNNYEVVMADFSQEIEYMMRKSAPGTMMTYCSENKYITSYNIATRLPIMKSVVKNQDMIDLFEKTEWKGDNEIRGFYHDVNYKKAMEIKGLVVKMMVMRDEETKAASEEIANLEIQIIKTKIISKPDLLSPEMVIFSLNSNCESSIRLLKDGSMERMDFTKAEKSKGLSQKLLTVDRKCTIKLMRDIATAPEATWVKSKSDDLNCKASDFKGIIIKENIYILTPATKELVDGNNKYWDYIL